jgi:hypothetical protein
MNTKKIIKSTLINIDSAYRNIYPKHIYQSNGNTLPNNPLSFTQDSNIININYPSHQLNNGDNIIIQNVVGISRNIVNSFYLLNKFKYLVIIFNDNMINPDYIKYTNTLKINIEIFGEIIINNMINNIPLNSIIGVKNIINANNIPLLSLTNSNIETVITNIFGSYSLDIVNNNVLFVELPTEFINEKEPVYNIKQTFKISYNHISGIPLGNLNANYPINNENYQASYQVSVIDSNNISIQLNMNAFLTIKGGGNHIQIMKILNSLIGYPDASSYTINLKKSFNNVINIELVSTEFAYVDLIIRKNVNDKLYWKNIEDANIIYSITIDEGSYTTNTLLNKMLTYMNNTRRIIQNSTVFDTPIYNIFDITFESNTQTIKFTSYNMDILPNSLSIRTEILNNTSYYILTVNHKNNLVSVGDIISISGSTNVTIKVVINNVIQIFSFSASYINTDHKVYSVDHSNMTYDIILGLTDNIYTELVQVESSGDKNVKIKSKTKVSFLFDKSDTFGDVIGFKNVGDPYSITDFNTVISNKDNYSNDINLDPVGNNINYSSGFVNLSGKYNYFLMYLNDIEFIYSNNNLPSAFAKIQLSGNPGDVLFNTFIKQPVDLYSKTFPISNLTDLNVKFLYPDGTKVEFRNTNHSFTLRIIEEQNQNDMIYLNSQNITYIDEMKKQFNNNKLL